MSFIEKPDIIKANYEFLSNAKGEIFDLFLKIVEDFDGSEYQQGKKDGLRIALSFLGVDRMIQDTREAREARGEKLSR